MDFQKIINEVINPSFMNIGFTKNGKKYILKRNHVIITVEIFHQTYHDEILMENILMNMKIYLDNSIELPPFMPFKSYNFDFPEISWYKINNVLDFEKLILLFKIQLKEVLLIIDEFENTEKIIEKGKEEIKTINNKIAEINKKLETIKDDQSYTDVLNISIKLNEKKIELVNDWINENIS